jgi:hypothetical protein
MIKPYTAVSTANSLLKTPEMRFRGGRFMILGDAGSSPRLRISQAPNKRTQMQEIYW